MRRTSVLVIMLSVISLGIAVAEELPPGFQRSPAQYPEPGLTFGPCDELPMPKSLLYSASPDDILADIELWRERGIDGFIMTGCGGRWEQDVWAADGDPGSIGEADATLQKVRKAVAKCNEYGMDVFPVMMFTHTFDWFDDVAWQHINHKFAQFAIFAREAGAKGVCIDIEYISDQYYFNWKGYDYDGYTHAELVDTMRKRMTGVAGAMYDAFPEMVFLTLPELDFRLGTHIQVAWIEEAARRNAPGGIHYLMGYTYRNHNLRYMFGRGWLNNMLMQHLLSKDGRRYWEKQCTLAAGVWPFGCPEYFGHGPELTPEELRHGLAGILMMSPRYCWVYSGRCREHLLERDMDTYHREEDIKDYIRVLGAEEMVTTPKFVALAKEIRAMTLRDYSADLGFGIETRILGPSDYGLIDFVPSSTINPQDQAVYWEAAIDAFHGRTLGLQSRFGTQTRWMVIGPFPNEGFDFEGHHAVYPPEEAIDLGAEYDGVDGKVRWLEHARTDGFTSIDLMDVFTPNQHVCAYALCYVTAREETPAQIRIGTNDAGKCWLGDDLVFELAEESGTILDKHVVPVTLPAGTTPILLKISNCEGQWGFVFRITDEKGRLMRGIEYTLQPPR